MKNTYVPTARSENIVIQEKPATEDGPAELLVYDLSNNRAHCLNETAALIWKRCDGNRNVEEIAKNLSDFGSEEMVWLGIDLLNKENLLVENYQPTSDMPSRREIIRKVGITSMIAIPIVSSLVAPSSVMAAASCGCMTPLDCQGTACPALTCNNAAGLCIP